MNAHAVFGEDRFQKKIDALLSCVRELENDHANTIVMRSGIEATLSNAIAVNAGKETINFLRGQVKTMRAAEEKKRSAALVMAGRIEQCQEFIDEDKDISLENDLYDEFREEITRAEMDSSSGANLLEAIK